MANIIDYKPNDTTVNTQSFADMIFDGRLSDAKNIEGKNLRRVLKAISLELNRYQSLLYDIVSTYIPNFTTSIIDEWEAELGIPDNIFDTSGTDDERRRNILIKLAYMNLQTEQDYINLANLLNLSITITNNYPTMTINISSGSLSAFPYTFPFTFGTVNVSLFQKIVLQQKPAQIEVVFT